MSVKPRVVTTIAAALLVGTLLPLGSTGTARAAAPLSALALKKSDVPAGYQQTRGMSHTLQQKAKSDKVSVATLQAEGWKGDYNTTFQKINKTTATEIDGIVNLFKNANGASWDLTHGTQALKGQFPNAKTFSMAGIGDQAVGITASGKSGKVSYKIVLVIFRRGSYIGGASIAVAGPLPMPSLSVVERYARIVDGRIKRA